MRPSRRSLWIPVLPFILAGCAAGEDADEDTSTDATDATDDGGGDALAVISLDPATGPLEGGTPVTVTGQGFVTGTTVTFDSTAASAVTVLSPTEMTLTTPAGSEAGSVDVTARNPEGATSTLVGGFTYTDETPTFTVGWCDLHAPASTSAAPGTVTEPILGQALVEGCTEPAGAACAGLVGELGWGTPDADPSIDPGEFTWVDAAYNSAFVPDPGSEDHDEFRATLTISEEGTYAYAYRFSMDGTDWTYCDLDGSDNGFSTDQMGTLDVAPVTVVHIAWCGLQWPTDTTGVATVPTEPIYGRVRVAGCTTGASRCTDVTGQVGYGATGSDPSLAPGTWTWTEATYNPEHTADDNDEHMATVTPTADGTYAYAFRFSGDGGSTWTYCDLDGSPFSTSQTGTLTVGDKSISWCNLQHPATSAGAIGVAGEDIYGRVLVTGCTESTAYCGGILGQVGFGTTGADPSTFAWADAAYNSGHTADDNDEYVGQMTPTASGLFEYAFRFSGDAGATWSYCDTTGSAGGYASADAGILTVE